MYRENPKTVGSGIVCAIPHSGKCVVGCADCFYNGGRGYLEPLEDNTPNMPWEINLRDKIVRVNDGCDSSIDQDEVISSTQFFNCRFFNTSIPSALDKFPDPVVLTINPAGKTDSSWYRLNSIPDNLMFVRVRTNTWNLESVVGPAIQYYTNCGVDVVLTFMAYYETPVPDEHKSSYEFKTRTLNEYWAITPAAWYSIADRFRGPGVYTCGHSPDEHSCATCGNCLRAYFKTRCKASG